MIPVTDAPPFPGAIYDANAGPMTADAPDLDLTGLDHFPYRGIISNDQPATYGAIWILNDEARYADIQNPWLRLAAMEAGQGVGLLDLPPSRDIGRTAPIPGRGILLLAHDPAAHEDVRRNLTERFQMFGTPRWRMRQA